LNDKNINRVITSMRAGDSNRWVAALAARRIDGAGTQYLAKKLSRSVDVIENLRIAGDLYVELREWCGWKSTGSDTYRKMLHTARRDLSISHFVRIGRLSNKYLMGTSDKFNYLTEASIFGYTVRDLEYAITIEHQDIPEYAFLIFAQRMVKNAEKLLGSLDPPEDIRTAAKEFIKQVEEWERSKDDIIQEDALQELVKV